jgi:two-component system alkaline phosphatase synthesis response regulator PhoP
MMENRKIVIADDEAHIIHVVQIKLQHGGFDVVTAMDGQEALDLVRSVNPSLVITDLQMPILSGLEVAASLFRDESTRDIPVFLLTAKGFEVDQKAMSNTNIKAVMTKPFSPRDLLSRVNDLIGVPVGAL